MLELALEIKPASVPLRAYEQLLRATREDLGHNNSTLLPGELLRQPPATSRPAARLISSSTAGGVAREPIPA